MLIFDYIFFLKSFTIFNLDTILKLVSGTGSACQAGALILKMEMVCTNKKSVLSVRHLAQLVEQLTVNQWVTGSIPVLTPTWKQEPFLGSSGSTPYQPS